MFDRIVHFVTHQRLLVILASVLLLFLGFAFLISAAATYWLSKKWGLIDGSAAGKGQGKIRG